ncbi:hypothetical protein [Nocardioides sp.]|uniref:hypothetical protein n=1 Tax=Nocardioides sp. TaxID=35761 RepID=UPI003D118D81
MALWPEAAKSVAPPVRSATTTQVARQCRDDVPCPSTMSLKGGGLWGAGRGGAACLWTYAVKDGLY